MTIFIYNYRIKPSAVRDFPVTLKNGKVTTGQTTFKEKRRAGEAINADIRKLEKECDAQDTKTQAGYERLQELREKIRLMKVELDFNENLEFVGEGEVNYGQGTMKDNV